MKKSPHVLYLTLGTPTVHVMDERRSGRDRMRTAADGGHPGKQKRATVPAVTRFERVPGTGSPDRYP